MALTLSEAHLGALSEVYLSLVTDLDSLTDLPPTEVSFGLDIDGIRGSLGYHV